MADNALIGQEETEGTAVVPQREKTLCPYEWALLSGMTNYKFREQWRLSFYEVLAINSESSNLWEISRMWKEGRMRLNECMDKTSSVHVLSV